MPQAGFEPVIPASEGAQTQAPDRAATEMGNHLCLYSISDCSTTAKLYAITLNFDEFRCLCIQLRL